MKDIYWIDESPSARLAIVARPRGGDWLRDDLTALKEGGIDVVVSLLEPSEAEELGLADEAALAEQAGIRFISWPIPDRRTPGDLAGFQQLVSDLCKLLQAGQTIGAHCRGCIGRSTVLMAAILITRGSHPETALQVIERARGCIVPDTPEQREWIHSFRPDRTVPDPRLAFPRSWKAETLQRRPIILPSRHFIYPRQAEEIERGALEVMIRPASEATFLATFALGFADPALPTGVWSCPNPDELCAVAGGYGYVVDSRDPQKFTQLPFRPVLEVRPLPEQHLLLFVGSIAVLAWGRRGLAWQSPRLSSEGLQITEIRGRLLHGVGWDLNTDRETPFVLDLKDGTLRDRRTVGSDLTRGGR